MERDSRLRMQSCKSKKMKYTVINQHGNFIDGQHRLDIIKAYILGLQEPYFEEGSAEIVEVINNSDETIIKVEIHIKDEVCL